jgi:acetyl esterase/lipase
MPWVLFAVSLAGMALLVNAYLPMRHGLLAVVSFTFGWLIGELPVQTVAAELVATGLFAWAHAFGAWPGWVGLGLGAVQWVGLAGLAVSGWRARRVVAEALDSASGGPVAAPQVDPRPVWNRLWRVGLAVPFRFRSVQRIRNIDYWGDGNYRHKLDVIRSRRDPPSAGPVLVYIHGGAWIIGDKREQGIPMMHELARRGWVCIAINYRLSPRATWPAHVVDCKRALAWVREHVAELGGDPAFVAVSGGSAGGHLAALVALTAGDPDWQPGFEGGDTHVDACVPFYGVYDLTGRNPGPDRYSRELRELLEERIVKAHLEDDPDTFEQASPTSRVHAGAPPMFVLHGRNDTLVPVEVARVFVDRLRAVSQAPVAYAELPYAQHAFDVLASLRCRATTLGVVRFLEGIRTTVGASRPEPTAGDQHALGPSPRDGHAGF